MTRVKITIQLGLDLSFEGFEIARGYVRYVREFSSIFGRAQYTRHGVGHFGGSSVDIFIFFRLAQRRH